jgi:hypothetical protein
MPHRFDRRATAMTNSDTTQPSFAGTNRIVTGPVRPVMLALVWPVLTEQFLNTLVGLIDTFLAGNLPYERVAATSAVGLAAYAGWLVSMLFALVGTGTTALVARSYGAGDRAGGNEIANQSIMMAIIMGLVGSVGMYALAPYFAGWLEMRGLTFDITVRYLRIDAFAYAVWAVSLVGAAALRGAGDMRTPLKVLALVNLLNVIISPTLVYGWGTVSVIGRGWDRGRDGVRTDRRRCADRAAARARAVWAATVAIVPAPGPESDHADSAHRPAGCPGWGNHVDRSLFVLEDRGAHRLDGNVDGECVVRGPDRGRATRSVYIFARVGMGGCLRDDDRSGVGRPVTRSRPTLRSRRRVAMCAVDRVWWAYAS